MGLIAAGAVGYYVYQQTRDPWKALVAGVVAGLTAAGLVVGGYLFLSGVAGLVETLAGYAWSTKLGSKIFELAWMIQLRHPFLSGAAVHGLASGLGYLLTTDDPNLSGFVLHFLAGATLFAFAVVLTLVTTFVQNMGGLRNTIRWGLDRVLFYVQRARYGSKVIAVDRGRTVFAIQGGDGSITLKRSVVVPAHRPLITYRIRPGLKLIPGSRKTGIDRAWKLERELIMRTGRGTRNWTQSEIDELIQTGRVRGYVGHHINSVTEYPEWAGDPRNIRFLPDTPRGGEHLHGLAGHRGQWRNPTRGRLIDREAMIRLNWR